MVLRRAVSFFMRSRTSTVRAALRKQALSAMLATLRVSLIDTSKYRNIVNDTIINNYVTQGSCSLGTESLQIADERITSTNKQINTRPEEPDPSDCCGNGCNDCVWTEYSERVAEWELRSGKL